MKRYKFFVEELDAFLDKIRWGNSLSPDDAGVLDEYINGRAAKSLAELADLKSIVSSGAYFTHHELAAQALKLITNKPGGNNHNVFDPTCGAGDLILAWCDYPSDFAGS